MKTIEIDDELYQYIAGQTQRIGESASDILRRLLLGDSAAGVQPEVLAVAEPEVTVVSSNIFDENIKWKSFNYPNNGRVNKKFQIFDKTIFARYEDDKNEDNVYWINGIEMVGDPTSVEDNSQIEEMNYLYTMPPYPNPTRSEVTAKFYWDSRIDIDNSEIAVFDITGNKVSGKENLTLEKLNEWSGNIKWNCVGQPKGTYLIKIQHGNNTKAVKVVVN